MDNWYGGLIHARQRGADIVRQVRNQSLAERVRHSRGSSLGGFRVLLVLLPRLFVGGQRNPAEHDD